MKITLTLLSVFFLFSCTPDTEETQEDAQEIIKEVEDWKEDPGDYEGSFEEQFP